MKVEQLFETVEVIEWIGSQSHLKDTVNSLCYNTKRIEPNTIFFALKGKTSDGARFISKAYELGCRVFVSQTVVEVPADSLLIIVEDSRDTLSQVSSLFFNQPSKELKVVGITGTKGKTTTTTLLYQVLKKAGLNAGVIGTNGIFYNDVYIPSENTTPESYELHKMMRQMVDAGVKVCFMEVSSQGLMMSRVQHVLFDIGVFTNMAIDHIGELEHPTFDNYLYWKTQLFKQSKIGLFNNDDAYVKDFINAANGQYYTYAIDHEADFMAKELVYQFNQEHIGIHFDLEAQGKRLPIDLSMPGKFNVYNALVVLAVAQLLDMSQDVVVQFLKQASVSGRMEIIPNQKGVLAILDYAHNGFSLVNVIDTLSNYEYNRLLILFGSVGDRSQGRRKELGDVVAQHADVAMITSDNPGHENPQAIIDDIKQSFVHSSTTVYSHVDRGEAIKDIVRLSQEGDIIVFAGKGHETYQLIGDEKVPFDEKHLIYTALNS